MNIPATADPVLDCRDLRKRFGQIEAVRDISFRIGEGETYGLLFPSTARTIAHVTPHPWANDAFSKLLQHRGDIATIVPQLGVLVAFAAVLITVAICRCGGP